MNRYVLSCSLMAVVLALSGVADAIDPSVAPDGDPRELCSFAAMSAIVAAFLWRDGDPK